MHPDGHSDVTQDQVLKKKEQKALFFFGWGGLERNKVSNDNFFCRTAPPAHLGLHQGSNFDLAGVSHFLVFPKRTLRFLQPNQRPGSDPGNQNKSIGNTFMTWVLNLTWNNIFKSLILQIWFFVLF
jgi:hypothetical protein